MFHDKLGGFRKIFKNRVEFLFLDAPHIIDREDRDKSKMNDENVGEAGRFKAQYIHHFIFQMKEVGL